MNLGASIVTGVVGVASSGVTGLITYKINSQQQKVQLMRDDAAAKRKRLGQTFKIYNEFLKREGESPICTFVDALSKELDVERYLRDMRPLLFSKLHLLHSEVALHVHALDVAIDKLDYVIEQDLGVREEALDICTREYENLSEAIRRQYLKVNLTVRETLKE